MDPHYNEKSDDSVDQDPPKSLRDLEATDDDSFDEAHDRKLVRRIDIRLMPVLCVIYGLALMDRGNLGYARVAGMGVTLNFERPLNNNKFSVALMIFFVGYILFELPSTLLLRRIHPRNFITSIVVLWGVITLVTGFIRSWEALVVCRAFLGVFEAGLLPACIYLISSWYKRYEVQRRLTVFYMSSVVASSLAAIFAYGLACMNGLGGLEGWRWIFIVLGIITIVAGAIAGISITDFPEQAKFLTEEERKQVIHRLDQDRGDAEHDEITTAKVLRHFMDWKIWALSVAFGCATMPTYALSYFTPLILRGLGYSAALSNLLGAPPYFLAVILALGESWWSDKIRMRTPFVIVNSLIGIAGFFVVIYGHTNGVKLFGTFLAVVGSQCQPPLLIGLLQNNITSSSKRAVASAFQIIVGGLGGIAASTIYQQKDAPKYINGLRATIIFHVGIILIVCVTAAVFHARNKQLDRESTEKNEAKQQAMSEKERALALWRHTL